MLGVGKSEIWKKKELWSGIRVLEFKVPDTDQCKVMAEPKR